MYLARYVFLGRALNTILNQQTSRFRYDHNMKLYIYICTTVIRSRDQKTPDLNFSNENVILEQWRRQ